jgi:hypothetical protein
MVYFGFNRLGQTNKIATEWAPYHKKCSVQWEAWGSLKGPWEEIDQILTQGEQNMECLYFYNLLTFHVVLLTVSASRVLIIFIFVYNIYWTLQNTCSFQNCSKTIFFLFCIFDSDTARRSVEDIWSSFSESVIQ